MKTHASSRKRSPFIKDRMYKLYIKMDDQIFGPYSAKEAKKLELLDDTQVREEKMEEWMPASKFNFKDMARQEQKEVLSDQSASPDSETEAKRQALKYKLQSPLKTGKLKASSTFRVASNQQVQPWPTIEFKANFNEGLNSIGGKIVITATQLIFRAHGFNFGDLRDRVFEIRDIVSYKKGFLTFMYISFSDGKTIKLTVWDKQRVINELEIRRKSLI